jgi:hypothetical protein
MPLRKTVADITLEDLDRQAQAANPGLLTEMAGAARNAICSIYQDSPGALGIGQKVTPYIFDVREAFLDQLCRPIGKLPQSRTAPFIGGQCPHVLYEVRLQHTETTIVNGQFSVQQITTSNTFYGVIRSVRLSGRLFLEAGGVTLSGYSGFVVDCEEPDGNGGWRPITATLKKFVQSNNRVVNDLGQITVTRIGGVDNCGDPSPIVPSNPPNVNNFNTTTNLTTNNNNVVIAPVTVIPTVIAPVTNIFRPEFKVDVGGVRVTIDPGGYTFGSPDPLTPGADIVDDPRQNPPSSVFNDNSIDLGNSPTDLTPVVQLLNKIDDELNKCCNRNAPFPTPENVTVTSLGNGNSGTVDLPDRCFAVKVTITTDLGELDAQSGDDGITVYQAGWVNFLPLEIPMQRQPIQHASNYYIVPERFAGSFAWKMKKDYTCNVSCYTSPKPS